MRTLILGKRFGDLEKNMELDFKHSNINKPTRHSIKHYWL